MLALAFLVCGFLLIVCGLALWSWTIALVVAGLVLFVSGGLDLAKQAGRSAPR